jgi:hypothetical protein
LFFIQACASGSEAVAGEDDNHSILITQANAEKERTMEAGNIVYRNLLTGEITTTRCIYTQVGHAIALMRVFVDGDMSVMLTVL